MGRKLLLAALLVACFVPSLVFAEAVDSSQTSSNDQIIAVATEAVKAKGYDIAEAQVIYDQDGKLWSERIGKMTDLTASPNFGIFQRGFMKNYEVVYFDYKEPVPDLWVFIDKDTGEVLEVYSEQQ